MGEDAEGGVKKMADEYDPIIETKTFRRDLDAVLQRIKEATGENPPPAERSGRGVRRSRERSLAVTKLQEAIMWLGMDLKAQDVPNPYPSSYDPSTQTIEPTADGVKL